MAETAKRRRLEKTCYHSISSAENRVPLQDPSLPATAGDKRKWKGFCEIESEPAFFNIMLKEFGVRGVKVEEVVSLDEEILALLSLPIYGLIFLYKWREEGVDGEEESCPETVWFANQTVKDACASVALLNIVNNIPGLALGDHLQAFRDFTADLNPVMRGEAVANFEFVKEIHNSFARKMDMLNADLQLKSDAAPRKKRKRKALSDQDEAALHFIAFVPVKGKLWKLDGLQAQPQNLGIIESDYWIERAKPEIEARMAEYEEEQIEFAILGLVKDPLIGHVAALAINIKSIIALERHLDNTKPDWKDFLAYSLATEGALTEGVLINPDPDYNIDQATLDQATILSSVDKTLQSDMLSDIIACRQDLVTEQTGLRMAIKEQQQSRRADEERAANRRHDHGPLVRKLLDILEHKHALKPLLK